MCNPGYLKSSQQPSCSFPSCSVNGFVEKIKYPLSRNVSHSRSPVCQISLRRNLTVIIVLVFDLYGTLDCVNVDKVEVSGESFAYEL